MRVGFVIPTFTTLGQVWYLDLLWPMQSAPIITGFLKRRGYRDIVQYDFDGPVLDEYRDRPHAIDLLLYDDDALVERFLRDDEATIRVQTERLVDLLQVDECDLYAHSLASVVGMEKDITRGLALTACLAKVIDERFPGATHIVGGLQCSPESLHYDLYRSLLVRSAPITHAGVGSGQIPIYWLLESLRRGEPLDAIAPAYLEREPVGEGGRDGVILRRGSEEGPHVAHGRPEPVDDGTVETLQRTTAEEEEAPTPRPAESRLIASFEQFPVDMPVADPSIPRGTPSFEPSVVAAHTWTIEELVRYYNVPEAHRAVLAPHLHEELSVLPFQFVQGCPSRCAFCANARTGVHAMTPAEVVAGLRYLVESHGCRELIFFNPNFNSTYRYADELLDALIAARLDIHWQDSLNLRAMDEPLVAKLRAAGLVRAVVGVEYPTRRMLRYINKGLTPEKLYRSLELLHEAGIWIHVLLIPGMPTETDDDLRELVEWIDATKHMVNAYNISPFYMVADSPFGRDPEKFGLELLRHGDYMQGGAGFHEVGGYRWEEKRDRIHYSAETVRDAIVSAKGAPKFASTVMDLHLVFALYRALGHDQKATIEEIYRVSRINHPHLAAARPHLVEHLPALLGPRRMELVDEPHLEGGELSFGARTPWGRASCKLKSRDNFTYLERVLPHTSMGKLFTASWEPVVGAGDDARVQRRRLGARVIGYKGLAEFVGRFGWTLTPSEDGYDAALVTLRFEGGGDEVVLTIAEDTPDTKAFVRGLGYALSFTLVAGQGTELDADKIRHLGKMLLAIVSKVRDASPEDAPADQGPSGDLESAMDDLLPDLVILAEGWPDA